MTTLKKTICLGFALTLLASLGACTVVPAYPAAYRGPAVYVDPYPSYRYGYPNTYHDEHYGRHYRDERRYDEPRRIESPLESAARAHRDVRRSLGLPRLPGMP